MSDTRLFELFFWSVGRSAGPLVHWDAVHWDAVSCTFCFKALLIFFNGKGILIAPLLLPTCTFASAARDHALGSDLVLLHFSSDFNQDSEFQIHFSLNMCVCLRHLDPQLPPSNSFLPF